MNILDTFPVVNYYKNPYNAESVSVCLKGALFQPTCKFQP